MFKGSSSSFPQLLLSALCEWRDFFMQSHQSRSYETKGLTELFHQGLEAVDVAVAKSIPSFESLLKYHLF